MAFFLFLLEIVCGKLLSPRKEVTLHVHPGAAIAVGESGCGLVKKKSRIEDSPAAP